MKEDLEDLIGFHVAIETKEAQICGVLIDCGEVCAKIKTYIYHIDCNTGVRKITSFACSDLRFDVVVPYREILDITVCVVEGPG